jgi:arabinogalactan endo-1,4-beta-galactosidase
LGRSCKQFKPALGKITLFRIIRRHAHTYDVIDALKVAGVTPEWVQVGNEIQAE